MMRVEWIVCLVALIRRDSAVKCPEPTPGWATDPQKVKKLKDHNFNGQDIILYIIN